MKNLLLITGLLFLFSCSSFENENPNALALQGNWELKSYEGGIGGWATDMDTVDYTIELRVNGEMAEWYIDDKVEIKYLITPASEDDVLLKLDPIKDSNIPRVLYTLETDKMRIADSCYDCYSFYYIKRKVGTPSPQ